LPRADAGVACRLRVDARDEGAQHDTAAAENAGRASFDPSARENSMKNDPNPDPAPESREEETVIGWEAIAERVSAGSRLPFSADAATRYAKRAIDRLPARKWGPRVYALRSELDAWIVRQARDHTGANPPPSSVRGK